MKIINRLHWYSFYLFLMTWPLSVRKILYHVPINGNFNEYTSVSIYISDIFLLLTALFWTTSLLYNNYYLLSIYPLLSRLKCSTWNNFKKITFSHSKNVPRGTLRSAMKKLFHVEQLKNNTQLIHRLAIMAPPLLITYLLITSIHTKAPILGVANTFVFIKLVVIISYIRNNVPRGTLFKDILWITSISGLIHSVVAILQFGYQKSLGLMILKESIINVNMPGVAKIPISEHLLIRAYGLFPHPNILGGFLLLSFIATFLLYILFHVEQLDQNKQSKCSTWNILIKKIFQENKNEIVPRGTISPNKQFMLLKGIFFILSLGIITSFSKTAMSGLLIFIVFCYFVPRGTFLKQEVKLFHVEQFKKLFATISLIVLIIFTITSISTTEKSLYERELYQNVSRGTFFENTFFGTGLGQSLLHMPLNYEPWQYQPAHNVFMLLLTEVGIIGTILFVFTIVVNIIVPRGTFWKDHKTDQHENSNQIIVPRGTISKKNIRMIIVFGIFSFIPALLFDHYIWDMNQGRVIAALLLALF